MRQRMKRWAALLSAGLFGLAACCLPAEAAGEGSAWGTVDGQQAVVYLLDAGGTDGITCQLGNLPLDVGTAEPVSALEAPFDTVILLDNSLSIPSGQRPLALSIVEGLIGNRLPGETFTIVTVGEGVDYLCEAESDYLTLMDVVSGIEYRDQVTHLTDGLYEVLSSLAGSQEAVMRRVVLIADGVDNEELGYTEKELDTLLQETGYPLYAVGCGGGNDELENLFALSRLTPGAAFNLNETQDTTAVVAGICAWNGAVRVSVPLPDTACDGAEKMMRLEAGDSFYTVSLDMPFVAVAPSEPEEPEEPEEQAEPAIQPELPPVEEAAKPEGRGLPGLPVWLAAGAGGLAAAAAVTALVLLRRRRKKEAFSPVPGGAGGVPQQLEETRLLREEGETQAVWEEEQPDGASIVLTDLSDPAQKYGAPVRGRLAIGRDPSVCRIVVDYDPTVARHQCDVFMENGQLTLQNRSHSNITRVDGQKVEDKCLLRNGCVIKMGRVQMRLEIV